MLKIKKFLYRNVFPMLMYFLPINNKKVIFSSYAGKRYSGNPQVISEKLYELYPETDIVWLMNSHGKIKNEIPDYVRVVENESFAAAYELYTAKVWVDNCRKPTFFKKRKEQKYIQTWHGTPLKLIEADAGDKLGKRYRKYAERDTKNIDLLISGNKYSTKIFKRAFKYDGEIFESGTPRNDILINDKTYGEKFKIKNNFVGKRIILFAPTFRNEIGKNGFEQLRILNPKIIVELFKNIFKNDCIILTRFHPNVVDNINLKDLPLEMRKYVFDTSEYPDIKEILGAADVLITDFSSIIFDYALLKRPIILFTPDENEYIEERGFYMDLNKLPLLKFNSSKEMIVGLSKLEINEISDRTNKLLEQIGDLENGNASNMIVKRINNVIKFN